MPVDWSRYPDSWPAIALAVKAAAGWRCQNCDLQCRRPGETFDTHRRTLTVHHRDGDPGNCAPENLVGLCSACHLRADAPMHAQHARETRDQRRQRDGGQATFATMDGWKFGLERRGMEYICDGCGRSVDEAEAHFPEDGGCLCPECWLRLQDDPNRAGRRCTEGGSNAYQRSTTRETATDRGSVG